MTSDWGLHDCLPMTHLRAPADASNATKSTRSHSRLPQVHLNAPPIANADGDPQYDPHEDDVDTPTIAGICWVCKYE
jgi:hypothetical protein